MMIEPFEKKHLAEVAEIERLSFHDAWSEDALLKSIMSPLSHFYVCTEDEKVVGYMGMYAVAGEGSVTNVAVHPDSRGKGYGRALVENAIAVGERLGLEYITLEVRESNLTAQKLYEKCGFQKVGVRKNFYSFPKEHAVIMQWQGDNK